MLEVAGGADVSLGEFLALLALDLLVLLAQAAVTEHVVELVGCLLWLVVLWLLLLLLLMMVVVVVGVVEPHIVDLRVLDVHCGHGESWAICRVTSFLSLALSATE